jgi:SAM-dependent methyltransferase
MKAYEPIVGEIVRGAGAKSVLDLPSGTGWLRQQISDPAVALDGIDLYEGKPAGYRNFLNHDLDLAWPDSLTKYDAIVSCEGLEHIANPGLFFASARDHLNPGGTLVITTPNTWHMKSRLQYLMRGFFPGFPSLVGKIKKGTHMHISPWSWPHLYLYLSLAGFEKIELHPCFGDDRTSVIERIFAKVLRSNPGKKARKASSEEEKRYWETAASDASMLSRRLVVSARKPG